MSTATVTRAAEGVPSNDGDITSTQLADNYTNLFSFLESNTIKDGNVNHADPDGIVVKALAQDITGLKSLENTSVAAGGVRTVARFGIDPVSGTPVANDGGRFVFYADDDGGAESDLAFLDWVMTDATAGAEVARMDVYLADASGAPVSQVQFTNGAILPTTDSDIDFGSASKRIKILFVDTIGDTGQDLAIAATTVNLPSGHVFDYDGGDVTWTHAAGKLTLGGDGAVEIDFATHEMTNVDINSGTIDGITSLTVDADLAFTGPQAITTSSGALTLTPNTDVHVTNGHGLVVGHTAQVNVGGVIAEIEQLGTSVADVTTMWGAWSADAGGPRLHFFKSRETTIGSVSKALDNDAMASFKFYMDDGNDYAHLGAQIVASVDGDVGTNDTPGRVSIWTTPDGGTAITERLRVDQVGDTYTNDGTISSLSDSKGKTDVTPYVGGLEVIKKLQPINFKFNGMYRMTPDDGVERVGFAADEVAKVAPRYTSLKKEAVWGEDENGDPIVIRRDEVYTLNQIKMIPDIVNAIKELSVELEALKGLA